MSYYYPEHQYFLTTAGTDGEASIVFHERMEIVACKIVDFAGVAAHSTNYVTFQVIGNDKTNVLFEWKTLDSANGALAANVAVDMVSQGHEDKAIVEAGEVLILKAIKAASGQATKASICLQLRQARSY